MNYTHSGKLMLSETGFCNFLLQNTRVELLPTILSGDYITPSTQNPATNLRKYQWDYIHHPESMIGIFQDDAEGAYTWTPVNKQYTLLFNHVYDNNHIGSMSYLKAIEDAIAQGNKDTLSLVYTADQTDKWTKEEKKWIDQWKIRSASSDEVFTDIIKSIKETDKNEKIEKIILRPSIFILANTNTRM